jgi:hypothetical protein
MTSLSRFVHRISLSSSAATTPARGDDRATRAAAMASAGPSEARTQGGGVAALLPRLRTQHRAVSAAVSVVAIGVWAFAIATPAHAVEPPYKVESFTASTNDGLGNAYTHAGGHLSQNDVEIVFPDPLLDGPDVKDAAVTLLPGFFGNPAAALRCPAENIVSTVTSQNDCPAGSVVGIARPHLRTPVNFTNVETALYNVKPEFGFPAQFAFRAESRGHYRYLLSATLLPRTESYGLSVGATNIARSGPVELVGFGSTFFGVPTQHGSGATEAPFLSNPLDCSEADPAWSLIYDSWQQPGTHLPSGLPDFGDLNWKIATEPAAQITGCDDPALAEQFNAATIATQPLQPGAGPVQADQPTGLAVDLDFPQSNDPTDPEYLPGGGKQFDPSIPQAPEPKDITVKLPAGLAISPSSADGLGACSDQASDPAGDQVRYYDTKPVACPDASKIGTAVALSPTLALHDPQEDEKIIGPEPIPGDVYLLKPHPGDLPIGGGSQEGKFRLLIQLENARAGINIKLPGVATADPQTGQLTTTFIENPQLPSSHITVSLLEGARAPLATPVTCGKFDTAAHLVPWGTPDVPDANKTASFSVGSGPNGTACPLSPATRPFAPTVSAGTQSSKAGASSPFTLKLTRNDGEQELSSFDLTTPPGFSAKLAGVPYCPEAAIAAASGRSGAAELASPSCLAASQLGTVTVAAGPGTNPYNTQGKAYLAGPYKGAPLSLETITPAVAGPFDLGVVAVRAALYVNPETAQVTVKTDQLPQIIDGVPLRLRSITAKIDRPNFTLNPTNCSPLSVNATVRSSDGASASPSNAFQVGSCKNLGFKPDLKLSLKGATKRSGHPALKATLNYPKGAYANIAKAVVSLPHSEFLAQNHIKTICTRVQFAADACPKGSIYGFVTATTPLLDAPLSGPLYLRSSSHPLPDLVAALHGQIDVDLVGRIDSKNGGIRTTFDAVPDAPVSKFVLTMQGGKKGLLENSKNLCNSVNKADVRFTAQNGRTANSTPVLTNSCRKAKKGKHGKGKAKGSKRTIAWFPSLGF